MTDEEKLMANIEDIFPYKEQRIMMFAYTAFIELLEYQKEKINNKVIWECYINGLKKMMNNDLELIKEKTNEK